MADTRAVTMQLMSDSTLPGSDVVPAEPAVLSYASSPPRIHPAFLLRHFHVWLLPILWLPGGCGSRIYHGDEYAGFAMANLPAVGVWLALMKVVTIQVDPDWAFILILATTFMVCAVIGWLLDRLRAWTWIYLLVPLAFVAIVRSRYAVPGFIPPLPYHPGQEWEWDAMCVAYCWGVYAIAAITLVGAALSWTTRIAIRGLRALSSAEG